MPESRIWHGPSFLLPFLALTSVTTLARAEEELVLDTWNGTDALSVNLAAGAGVGSQITIANDPVTISSIAVRVDLAAASNLKFVIFSHPDHEVVYVSEPKLFTDDGMSWKKSNTLDVVLPPGTYDISAVGLVGGVWQYDEAPASSGNYSSKVQNPYFVGYASPTLVSHGFADGAVRLYARIPECGDGFVDVNEECDDGNTDNTDECLDTCVAATCGDGFVWSGHEDCDDANSNNTDECLDTCVAATCGDGFVWSGHEECDDGNDDNTDLCLDTCVAATCGDGFVGPGEGCDDGNDVDDDACSNECVSATCGDGSVQLDEACDDGNSKNDDGCTNACTLPTCGDKIVQKGEECDDGNSKNDDGCARDCTVEKKGEGGAGGSGEGGAGEGGSGEGGSGEGGAGEGGCGRAR